MTREEFKDSVLNILLGKRYNINNFGTLFMFDAEDISRYKIAQYDEEDWDVESAIPLDEFLNEIYEVIR